MNGGETDGRGGEPTGVVFVVACVVAAVLVPWLGAGVVGAASCTTVSGGTVIDDAGCYVLQGSQSDGDEEDSDASRFVEVRASDVVVDGNGTTIDGDGSGEAVHVDGAYSNVTVRNVTLTDWDTGIYVRDASDVVVEDLDARSNGVGVEIDATTNAVLARVNASDNADHGVHLRESPGGVIANVTADRNGMSGVVVENSDGATVGDATVADGGAHGLLLTGSPDASAVRVTVEGTNTDGVHVGSSGNATVRDSTVRTAGRHGVLVTGSPNASVVRTTAEDAALDGVHVDDSDGAVVRGSTARRPGQHGVHVADSNANASVLNNVATNGTDYGFRVHHSDGGTVAGNVARDNAGGGIRVSSELATVRDNRIERNAVGIYLYKHSHVVENNTVRANAYGVTLDGDDDTVAHNRVVGSTTAGFHYVSGKDALIYDNLFDNTVNAEFDTDPDPSNRWNVTPRTGTNVLGGSGVGGNAWLDPAGDGHSELWNDTDGDGFVDAGHTVDGTNVDEHPLQAVETALTIVPGSHDYGDVTVGSNATRTFVVESRAAPEVTVDRSGIAGADTETFAVVDGPTPATLSTGESVPVNVTFAPTAVGPLSASLHIGNDSVGATATLSGSGTDGTAPTAAAGPDPTVDNGTAVGFDGTDSTDDVGIVSYEWAFGDGDTATGATPTHTYPAPGTYTATLTLSDAAGNTDTDTITVTVESEPDPDAEGDDGGGGGGGVPVATEPTGEVTITDRTLSTGTASAGSSVPVRIALANRDVARGRITLALAANDSLVAERTVAVGADGSRTVTLRATFDDPGRYPLAVNGVPVGTVEVTADPSTAPAGNATGNDTAAPEPTPSPPADLDVEVDGEGESSADVAVRDVEPNRSVPVEFGNDAPSTADVSFESIAFTPTEGGPVTMNVTASGEPLPGSPAFDRADNTSGLAHLRVEHSIANADVEGALVRFGVSAARLDRLDATPDEVALYRYGNGSWAELPTRPVRETADGYVFVAESPGLSEFAAGAKQPQFELRTASVAVERVSVGDEVRVRVRITNTGGADGSYTAKLLLNESVVGERRLTIAANGTRQVLFNHRMERPGNYRVLVNGFPAGNVSVSGEASGNGTVAVDRPASGGLGWASLAVGGGALSVLLVGGGLYRWRD
jgi:PGF-pre-PGF domain-containing protein